MNTNRYAIALLLVLALGGCDDPISTGAPPPSPPRQGVPAAPPPVQVEADAGVAEEEALPVLPDEAFAELDVTNRDPFRGFGDYFRQISAADDRGQRRENVKLAEVAVDDMRLIAVVTGSATPVAMIQGPDGNGIVVQRGDFIGQDQLVETGGSESLPVRLNWRVSRIRPSEVILTREDPTAPNRPPLTRSLPLYAEGEEFSGNVLSVDITAVESGPSDQVDLGMGQTIRIETTPVQIPTAPAASAMDATPAPSRGRQGISTMATPTP